MKKQFVVSKGKKPLSHIFSFHLCLVKTEDVNSSYKHWYDNSKSNMCQKPIALSPSLLNLGSG